MRRLLTVIILCSILLSGCSPQSPSANTSDQVPTVKGVDLSPISFSNNDFTAFFTKAKSAGTLISWAGDWKDLNKTVSPAKALVALAAQYGFHSVIITGMSTADAKDAGTVASFKQALRDFLAASAPDLMGIGNEINSVYEESPAAFNSYVTAINDLYSELKPKFSTTQFFTVFQLEKLKGLKGGLFGGKNDPDNGAEWQLLSRVENLDFLAFTSYPCLIYSDPSAMPKDYYSEINKHTTAAIALSEVGWFRSGPTGWESSVNKQVAFINELANSNTSANLLFIIWSFLYDQPVQEPFKTMGLLTTTEDTSPAFEAWQNL